jgi:hypothetical protein
MKSLVIKIKDASIFKPPSVSRSQDKVLDIGGKDNYKSRYNKRTKECTPYVSIPAGQLSIKHVSNLLRVLWGERPVPSMRAISKEFIGDLYFDTLAKETRVEVSTPIFDDKKGYSHDKPYYPEETATIRKSIGDSYQTATRTYFLDGKNVQIKGGLLYSDRLRYYIGEELYREFIDLVDKYGDSPTIQGKLELLNVNKDKNDVIKFCKKCKNENRTSISNIILNSGIDSITFHTYSSKHPLTCLMTCGGVDIKENFSCNIYVPVSDDDLRRVKSGPGVATFLEGGIATVEYVEELSTELLTTHTKPTV